MRIASAHKTIAIDLPPSAAQARPALTKARKQKHVFLAEYIMNELLKKGTMQETFTCPFTARLYCKGRLLTQNTRCAVKPGDTLHLSTSQQKLRGGSDGYTRAPGGEINLNPPANYQAPTIKTQK